MLDGVRHCVRDQLVLLTRNISPEHVNVDISSDGHSLEGREEFTPEHVSSV